jgi:hypothetical protein
MAFLLAEHGVKQRDAEERLSLDGCGGMSQVG